ncbi:hypothetical protein ACJIZ3_007486 [Penstemon smallii]|uniref:DUF4378 domain-containing protein n=1 Tax=Penstemon smallii TaxID=265156 RepID=A0ABD3SAV9_9LAMI
MPKEMATKQPESVLARLMGIDVQSSDQHSLRNKCRVLSDSYIRKAACVGLRHGSSFTIRRSSITHGEMLHGVKNHDIVLYKCSNSNSSKVNPGESSVSKSLSGASYENRTTSKKKGKHYAPGYVLRYLQKIEYDSPAGYLGELGVDYVNKHIEYQSKMIDKPGIFSDSISVFKPKSVKVVNDFEDFKLDLHSKSMQWNLNLRFGRNGWNLKQGESTWRDKLKKQKISHKDILESRGVRGREQNKFYPGANVSMSGSSRISESSASCISCCDSEKPEEHGQENELSQSASKSSISNSTSHYAVTDTLPNAVTDTLPNAEALNKEVCSRISAGLPSESDPGNMSMEVGHFSYVQAVSSGEASSNEVSEEESAYRSCSRTGPSEFHHYLKGTNKRSPDSIPKPFDNQNSLTFEWFQNIGLQLQLQVLNSESEETYSEGSAMIVSDDEDSVEGSGHIPHNSRKVQKWFGDYESRNFSYLVDILDAVQFCNVKSFIDFKTWHSLEFPINPSVFDSLEKEYGKQTSWQKSERRLLFDRINLGLMDIVNRGVNIHLCTKSVRRWFRSTAWRRDEVEDELWRMLISKAKEMSGYMSEKDLDRAMKWLEFEEDTSIICVELETFLFDELVMELASLWN